MPHSTLWQSLATLDTLQNLSSKHKPLLKTIDKILLKIAKQQLTEGETLRFVILLSGYTLSDLFALTQVRPVLAGLLNKAEFNPYWDLRLNLLSFHSDQTKPSFTRLMGCFLAHHALQWELAGYANQPAAHRLIDEAIARGIQGLRIKESGPRLAKLPTAA